MDPEIGLLDNILLLFFLVFIGGVFTAAEFSIVRCTAYDFKNGSTKKLGSETALSLIEDMNLTLSASHFGLILSVILIGWFSQYFYFDLLSYFGQFGFERSLQLEVIVLVFTLLVILFISVLFGELIPKSLAISYPIQTLRLVAGTICVFKIITKPFLFLLNFSTNFISKLINLPNIAYSNEVSSFSELTNLVTKSAEEGLLDQEGGAMVKGVIGLSNTVAREIMTPRTDLVTIPVAADFHDVLHIIRESGFSRFPVHGDNNDDILGVLLSRDILNFTVPELVSQKQIKGFNVKNIMRESYFIPGTMPVDQLLAEFKKRKLHLAIVLDEHGGVDGVVSLEDLLEEIVGDIFDESDVPEKTVDIQANGEILIDGGQLVTDINNQFYLDIPEGDYDTIAGFIFTTLGRMPKPGDSIVVDRILNEIEVEEDLKKESNGHDAFLAQSSSKALITVEKVQSHRIESVRLKPCQENDLAESVS